MVIFRDTISRVNYNAKRLKPGRPRYLLDVHKSNFLL